MTHPSVQRIESLLVPEVRYNDAPLSASTTDNWVARHGGLPPFVRAIVRALERSGKSESTAIATAIAAVKRWAAGGGNVHPSTRARAAAAVAHWEASKLAAHLTRNDDESFIEYLLALPPYEPVTHVESSHKRDQALAILERRVGPHGYEHGWIKVGEEGATSTRKVSEAIGIHHRKHSDHPAFAKEQQRLSGPAEKAGDALLHSNFTDSLLRAKDAQKKGNAAAAAKHLGTAVAAEKELRRRGRTPMFHNKEVRGFAILERRG